jgi:hypothetical protein
MFAKTIIDSDAFIDMPVTARLLYYDLSMRADDDGFVNSPKKIMRMIGASQDDLSILIMRKFIIPFDSGVVVIKHWRIHNYIRKDMYHETKYKEEKETLSLDENNAYTLHHRNEPVTNLLQTCNEDVSSPSTEDRIGKDRIGKDSINNPPKRKRFVPPTIDEVKAYCEERKNNVDAERFIDYYSSQNWKKANGRPLEDWKAAVRTWEKNNYDKPKQSAQPTVTVPVPDYMQKQIEDFEKNYGW